MKILFGMGESMNSMSQEEEEEQAREQVVGVETCLPLAS